MAGLSDVARLSIRVIQLVVPSFASLTKGASKMLRATGHARMVTFEANRFKIVGGCARRTSGRAAREGLWYMVRVRNSLL